MPFHLLAYFVGAVFAALVVVVVFALIGGRINLSGMLSRYGDGEQLIERQLALGTTLAGVFAYLYVGLSSVAGHAAVALPEVPPGIIEIVAGGQFAYLAGKLFRGETLKPQ